MSKRNDHRCDVCQTPVFERNHYFTGKLMVPRDFRAEQEYFNEKRWLLNRSLFGWGVVCGLDVEQREEGGPLIITPGMALDCCGHEILVCEELCVSLDTLREHCPKATAGSEHQLVICLEYHECKTEPVADPNTPDCEGSQRTSYNRVRDSYQVRIRSFAEMCLQHEPECYLDHLVDRGAADGSCRTPSLHEYLCRRSKTCRGCESCDCVALADLLVTFPEEPGHAYEDDVGQEARQHPPADDECEEPEPPTVVIDTCTYRRLVYANPLLHELIACFHRDAPRIVGLKWREWVEDHEVAFDDFVDQLLHEGIAVVFNQPIDPETLHRRSFVVAAIIADSNGYRVRKEIPSESIEYRSDESHSCYTAVFHTDPEWVPQEITRQYTELHRGFDIEILLRGSMIIGENGFALDGEYMNGRLPTGNGVQAGDFIDWFAVAARDAERRARRYGDEEEPERYENF